MKPDLLASYDFFVRDGEHLEIEVRAVPQRAVAAGLLSTAPIWILCAVVHLVWPPRGLILALCITPLLVIGYMGSKAATDNPIAPE